MSDVLLSVDDLRVNFRTGERVVEAVRGISLEIKRGETLALVGESGSGKSVTALSIMQLLPYPPAFHPSGSIQFKGRELIGADGDTMSDVRGDEIGMIFQEPMTSLNPLHRVRKQINEVLFFHKGMDEQSANARTLELLELVGIRDAAKRMDSYPHQMSGGQRQRVMIAMALANEPDLLIADEPTTALDVTIQAQILALLDELQSKLGMAMLLITHDLGVVEKVSDRVCVMRHGEILERGVTREIFTNPQHEYTQHLLDSEPKGTPPPADPSSPVLLEADDLKVWFPVKRGILRRTVDHIKAVDGVSFSLRQGQTLGVVGESGSGKTTLALALLRLVPSTGAMRFAGKSIDAISPEEMTPLRREMQIVFQDPYGSLSPRMSVGQIIAEGLEIHGLADNETQRDAMVVEALNQVELDPVVRHRYPHEFSGGQRQRIAIARSVILKPKLMMLDEPTSALDRSVQAQIIELLRRLQRETGLSYIFISHDLKVVRALADQLIVMRTGKVVEQGSAEKIFDAPAEPYTRALLSAAFDLTTDPGSEIDA